MTTFHTAEVMAILEDHPGLQRVTVRFENPDQRGDRAYVLTGQVGPVAVGDRVVCNTTAVDLGLGTGGWHVVHWNLSRQSWSAPGPDHVMKLRYTSLQLDAGTSELIEPHLADRLDGLVVVACLVHSQLPVVAAAIAAARPDTSVTYVMTDGASLPIVMSDTVRSLRAQGLIERTITSGHAFGGDLESVTVASGLALAATRGADVAIVSMGPGVVGTGTTLGTTAIEAAGVLDLAARLGAEPVLCVRASEGDPRDRHRGVSHHTRTVALLTGSAPWVADIPDEAAQLPGVRVCSDAPGMDPYRSDSPDAVASLLERWNLRVTTMGRLPAADPLFFRAAAAAGVVAAGRVSTRSAAERSIADR